MEKWWHNILDAPLFSGHAMGWPTDLGKTPSIEKSIISIIYIQQNAPTETVKLVQVSECNVQGHSNVAISFLKETHHFCGQV